MEQISLPYRIVLVAVAVLGVVWFVAMRPGTTETPANAPGVTGLANATQAARDAAAQSQPPATAAQPSAATQTPIARTPVPAGTPSKTERVARDRSGPILADLKRGRVAVVAFSGKTAADDRGVRHALSGVNLHGGKVVVRSVSIADVADYGAITRGVQVQQAPTVLVIGKDHKARTIVGFTDSSEINQLVSDVGGNAL